MSIFKRLRNLWILSGFDMDDQFQSTKKGIITTDSIMKLFRHNKKATIVDMSDPLSVDLGDNQ